MRNQKSTLLLTILLISVFLISRIQQESRFTETVLTITPTATIVKGQIILFSNFDPSHEHGFTREGLANPRNTKAFFDFDKGEITITDSADIYLDVSCGTDCFNSIIEINGAKAARFGEVEPGYDGCRRVLAGENNLPVSVGLGKYSCLQTNDGNIVQMLVINDEAFSQNARFVFEYIIWYQNQ